MRTLADRRLIQSSSRGGPRPDLPRRHRCTARFEREVCVYDPAARTVPEACTTLAPDGVAEAELVEEAGALFLRVPFRALANASGEVALNGGAITPTPRYFSALDWWLPIDDDAPATIEAAGTLRATYTP